MLAEVLPGRVRREPIASAPYVLLPDSAEAFRATLSLPFQAEDSHFRRPPSRPKG